MLIMCKGDCRRETAMTILLSASLQNRNFKQYQNCTKQILVCLSFSKDTTHIILASFLNFQVGLSYYKGTKILYSRLNMMWVLAPEGGSIFHHWNCTLKFRKKYGLCRFYETRFTFNLPKYQLHHIMGIMHIWVKSVCMYPKVIQDKGYISPVAKVLEISNVPSLSCEEVLEVGLQNSEHFICFLFETRAWSLWYSFSFFFHSEDEAANKVAIGLMRKMATNSIFTGCNIIPSKLDTWKAGGFFPDEARTCGVPPSLL